MSLNGKRVGVMVEAQYQELEVWYPLLRAVEAGAEAFTIGPQAGVDYPSKLGYPAKADRAAETVRVDDFDALVIPGGFAPDFMRRSPAMVRLVAEALKTDKVVAAICHGGWMLASCPEQLAGKRCTSFFAIKDDMVNAGGVWEDAEVVVDGKLITARKPTDLPAFCREMIKALGG
jgi:protease I